MAAEWKGVFDHDDNGDDEIESRDHKRNDGNGGEKPCLNLFHVQKSISGKNNINEKQEEKNHHSKKRPRIVYLS